MIAVKPMCARIGNSGTMARITSRRHDVANVRIVGQGGICWFDGGGWRREWGCGGLLCPAGFFALSLVE